MNVESVIGGVLLAAAGYILTWYVVRIDRAIRLSSETIRKMNELLEAEHAGFCVISPASFAELVSAITTKICAEDPHFNVEEWLRANGFKGKGNDQ